MPKITTRQWLKNKATIPLAITTLALLSACGGGSSGGNDASVGKAEGVYQGTTTTRSGNQSVTFALNALVLEDDEAWVLYGTTNSSGDLTVYGFVQAPGSSGGGTYTSSAVRDFYYNGVVTTGSVSASYVPGQSFNGTLTYPSSFSTFTAMPLTSSTYSYGKPAVIADVAGSWTGNTLGSASTTTLTISNSGVLSGNSSGCLISGSVTPRASGKSVFDVALTFGPAPCALPGQSARGIALSYLLTSGKRQFILAGVTPSRNSGAAFLAIR